MSICPNSAQKVSSYSNTEIKIYQIRIHKSKLYKSEQQKHTVETNTKFRVHTEARENVSILSDSNPYTEGYASLHIR